MGKRQTRISAPDLSTQAEKIVHKYVNIVMQNGTVWMGLCVSILAKEITIKDAFNTQHRLPLSEIAEIIYDYTAEY